MKTLRRFEGDTHGRCTQSSYRAWIERNVNNTGWYDVSGDLTLPDDDDYVTKDYWNGPEYAARACFRFDWGSSLVAVHCTEPISFE